MSRAFGWRFDRRAVVPRRRTSGVAMTGGVVLVLVRSGFVVGLKEETQDWVSPIARVKDNGQ